MAFGLFLGVLGYHFTYFLDPRSPSTGLEVELGYCPPAHSWIISIVGLYIALNMTPSINCYWEAAVPKG